MDTKNLTAYYNTVVELLSANQGQLKVCWKMPVARQLGDEIGIYPVNRCAIIYRAQDSDRASFYTYVGSDPDTYLQVERWRMHYHHTLLYLPEYGKEFDDLFKQYHARGDHF